MSSCPCSCPHGGERKPRQTASLRGNPRELPTPPFGPTGWNSVPWPQLLAREAGHHSHQHVASQTQRVLFPKEKKGGEWTIGNRQQSPPRVTGQPLGCDGERWGRSWRHTRVPGPRGYKTDVEDTRIRDDDEGELGLPWEEGKEEGLGAEGGSSLVFGRRGSVRNNPGEKAGLGCS